jgi:hypothetical protein
MFLFCGKNHYWGHLPRSVRTVGPPLPPTSSIEIENAGGGVFQQDGTLPNFYMFTML